MREKWSIFLCKRISCINFHPKLPISSIFKFFLATNYLKIQSKNYWYTPKLVTCVLTYYFNYYFLKRKKLKLLIQMSPLSMVIDLLFLLWISLFCNYVILKKKLQLLINFFLVEIINNRLENNLTDHFFFGVLILYLPI